MEMDPSELWICTPQVQQFPLIFCLERVEKAAWKNKGLHFYKNKASINSPEETTFPNWYSEDCCQWEAVECYASTTRFKDLKELELPGNNIKGFTSPHEHKHLQTLGYNAIQDTSDFCWGKKAFTFSSLLRFISYNQFSGSFPSLLVHNLTSIESLHLSNNLSIGKVSFSIFANLSRLGQLDISYIAHLELEIDPQNWSPSFNMYVLKLAAGTIPSWVMHNTTSRLWVSGNNLSGHFPEIFRNISSQLTSLDVSDNSFHGPLLEDINLIFPELVYIYANNNGFNGLIPTSFVRLKQLLALDLSSNELGGEIPFFVTSNMSSLEILHLHQNKLRGYVLPRNSSLP
ncbi:hypothetical protein Gotri_025095 [Gossypium trilobum]|uniref:Leucine-rich repeat-containing N-terminal plant-type domain-containing protein n=1 Tax=Gossypium trilobum TaxID=34281 RepID=A0A7J9FNN8_9ROSI|nr:hypothetical protein [Gossypium trilobum]